MYPTFNHMLIFMLATLITSEQHPVPTDDHGKFAVENTQQLLNSSISKGHTLLKRYEPQEEIGDVEALSPDTIQTMRKINPLTIANQVSQMFSKGGQKASLSKKPPNTSLIGEDFHAISNYAVHPDGEEVVAHPTYIHQQPPKIVNKPLPSDFGYSVIVLAGDPVNFPFKLKGKDGQDGIVERLDLKDQGNQNQKDQLLKISNTFEQKLQRKNPRVPKQYNVNPEFPVYDDDFKFDPDPFQGILDENYWNEANKNDHKTVSVEDFRKEDDGFEPHSIQLRSVDYKDSHAKLIGDFMMPCGDSWGKNSSNT